MMMVQIIHLNDSTELRQKMRMTRPMYAHIGAYHNGSVANVEMEKTGALFPTAQCLLNEKG